MEHRDLIKDEIERLAKVIAKLTAELLGVQLHDDFETRSIVVNKKLKEELDVDVMDLLALGEENTEAYLKVRKLTDSHIEQLSDYFVLIAKAQKTKNSSKSYLEKAVQLLKISNSVSKTMSLSRLRKIEAIKSKIESL